MNIKLLIGLSLFLMLWSSCQKELIDPDEKLLIEDFLNKKGIPAQEDPDAGYYLHYYQQLSETDTLIKATLNAGMKATLSYKSYLLDETLIHETDSAASERIAIDNAIVGLQLVLSKIAVGEKVLAVFPSRLAYGETSLDNIPSNSIIVFELVLIDLHPHF